MQVKKFAIDMTKLYKGHSEIASIVSSAEMHRSHRSNASFEQKPSNESFLVTEQD